MDITENCRPCLIRFAADIATLSGMSPDQIACTQNHVSQLLAGPMHGVKPPMLAAKIYDWIQKNYYPHATEFDPYRDIKARTNAQALECIDTLRSLVVRSPDPLVAAVKVAAAGNIVDFAAKEIGAPLDMASEIARIPDLPFGIFDIETLRGRLAGAGSLLYVGDNSGEIVFDRVCIEGLRCLRPGLDVHFAVRERPVINDVTRADAAAVGMDRTAHVLSSGSVYPGTVLGETSTEFRHRFDVADLIIAKGQGNFETLHETHDPRLFFILRVKCDCISSDIGAPLGSLVLMNMRGKPS